MFKRQAKPARKRILREANFLDLTPVRLFPHRIESDQTFSVRIPKFRSWPWKQLLQPRVRHPWIFVSLDREGSLAWALCDGEHQVRDICQKLRGEFGPGFSQAEDRVTRFLGRMYTEGFVVFKEVLTPEAFQPDRLPGSLS